MLPSVQPAILSANPKFEALYRDLCANKLSQDGTTKLDIEAKRDRDTFGQQLNKARLSTAKEHLIRSYIQRLASQGQELPVEVQELLEIISAALRSHIDAPLLQDDVQKFKDHIKPIAKGIWKLALDDLIVLARICSPTGTIEGEDLPRHIRSQHDSIASSTAQIHSTRLEIANEAVRVHELYQSAMQTCIHLLEQTIHGSVSRHTKAHGAYLAAVAEGMSQKLQLQHVQILAQTRSLNFDNDDDVSALLDARLEELKRQDARLKARLRDAEERLEDYRHSSRLLDDVAQEYTQILAETRKAQADIERLVGRSSTSS